MSTALTNARPDVESANAVALANDHRIALLTARTALEPALAQRYTEDPRSLLAEFGLVAVEPAYAAWGTEDDTHLLIEDLDRTGSGGEGFSIVFTKSDVPFPSVGTARR
ncbi:MULTISPECIES: hypothetical protein [Streptomyces]|uniref:hypothetical protein n=1 Tax=Streptomyces TaxID=1883 RepID=UPI0007CD6D25|nr:hypothetical protein A4V12_22635 [Streptomyces noursei]